MPKPRKALIAPSATPYYHCTSRCVRRAFLCGQDAWTGRDYSHRRAWIEQRLQLLAHTFAIDLCAYAVMSNHLHAVLHVNTRAAQSWNRDQVIERWHRLFKGSIFSQRYIQGIRLHPAQSRKLDEQVAQWRTRLQDISWFMRCLNESIARQANQEDGCTGRFWEGRFKSQALLDEKALAACMAYVDLNPIRANMADRPETSNHTSIKQRIKYRQQQDQQPGGLFPFAGHPRQDMPEGLPFRLDDYLALVDWTGRQLREDKRGAIDSSLPSLLERLAIEPKHWLFMSRQFEHRFKGLVGTAYALKAACQQLGYQRTIGLHHCRVLLG